MRTQESKPTTTRDIETEVLTERAASEYAAVSTARLRRHRKAGRLPFRAIAGNGHTVVVLYERHDIDQWIKEHRRGFVYA